MAELGQHRDRYAADAACGTGHNHLFLSRCDAHALQVQDAQHGGIASRTHGHGLFEAEGFGHARQPFGFDPLFLGIATAVGHAEFPAGDQDLIAMLIGRGTGGLDRPGQVDPTNHGVGARNGRGSGDGQAVFVIQRGIGNVDGHIPGWQIVQRDFFQLGRDFFLNPVDNNCVYGFPHAFQLLTMTISGDQTSRISTPRRKGYTPCPA